LTYWLDNFAYRIELKWWYFLSAAGITLLISWLTIGVQTIKAAMINPVTMLRSE
jgi:putative ABC transport system permease protein